MKKLITPNLEIRNHIPSDWKDLHEYLSLPEIYKFEPGGPISVSESRALIKKRCNGDDFLAVKLRESGKMIGHLYFHRIEPERFLTWELGFIFNPDYQNHGYCTEASAALVRYAFEALDAHKITAYCNPENTSSWKVLEKIGMIREGHFKKKGFFRTDPNGNPLWHDAYAYGMLKNS
ncbi:GNAT family N-acetyltransferase [Spirochaeta isovalerica]|uniref:RimJ/RimL family protein N-acetyltransferase n=1 Tax=Spirochaeta isovalerica TaxID=150 RepID=A0A841RC56_9SPIO|nr:GNAT family N-acetyltransferase [Spirochaeta isovalerica]MBB6481266.1 RimJ/RimL family protein N-acetyltransferase [Spirochaeta isovalerica]